MADQRHARHEAVGFVEVLAARGRTRVIAERPPMIRFTGAAIEKCAARSRSRERTSMADRLPTRFQTMRCRSCQRPIKPNKSLVASLGKRLTVRSRDDCIYRCTCGVSYSNARNERDRVLITASPELNVPKRVRTGLAETLGQAGNRRNRRNKAMKFCFETSEDAVTWTVFRGLGQWASLGALVAPQRPLGEPTVLLWGVPIGGGRAPEIASALADVCRSLGEAEDSYTEPDVIVAWPDLVVIVEARFLDKNPTRPNYRNFPRYLDRRDLFAVPPEEVAAAGYYELTRNWRIGTALAENLGAPDFLLVNLGPPEKIEGDAEVFASLLARSPSRDFTTCSWSDILEAAAPLEPWLDRYASDRHRLLYWR
jgi:hypothetical protein